MKELLELCFKLKFRELFYLPTENEFIKFFRYCFIGGIAFVVDYGVFAAVSFPLPDTSLSIAFATVMGFIFGLITNFALSKLVVFTQRANTNSTAAEFFVYAVIGVIGCGLTVILMLIAVKFMNKYIAKAVVQIIILFYNYITRKVLLYSGGKD
ncbi:MAG: GtrA family protein [Clostridiales bacterium]|nr:GtrA family protein [Clostridiales bacterium]